MYGVEIAQPLRYPGKILQIYWIHKDAIALTSRWKVTSVLKKHFFKNEVQRVIFELVLFTYPLDHSQRIYSPLNFRFIQKTKK